MLGIRYSARDISLMIAVLAEAACVVVWPIRSSVSMLQMRTT